MANDYEFPEIEPTACVVVPAPAPDNIQVKQDALSVPKRAEGLSVVDQVSLDRAKDFLVSIDKLQGSIDITFDPQIAQAHKLHKSLLAEKKKFTEPLDIARRIVGKKVAGFLAEEERRRNEILQKAAEAERKAQEIARKAVKKAEALNNNGDDKAASRIVDEAQIKVSEVMAAVPDIPEGPNTKGLTVRTVWKFEITQRHALPLEYLMPDEKKIGRMVQAFKADTNIPGVRVWSEKTTSLRSAEEEA